MTTRTDQQFEVMGNRILALEKALTRLQERLGELQKGVDWKPNRNGYKHYEAILGDFVLALQYTHFKWWAWVIYRNADAQNSLYIVRRGKQRELKKARNAILSAARELGILAA